MIYQGRNDAGFVKDEIHVTTGLQLLRNVAVDTHFVRRGRIVRMAQVLATNPGCLGLGLEEDTAVLVSQGRELEVIGNGIVVLLDAHNCTSNTLYEIEPGEVFSIRDLRLHLLAPGKTPNRRGGDSIRPKPWSCTASTTATARHAAIPRRTGRGRGI